MRSSPSRITALVLGVVFVLIGALGFTADSQTWLFGILSVNAAQNVLHLVIGAALVGIAGLFIISTPSNFIAVNGAANLLHFVSAAVLLAVGLGARR